MIVNPDPLAPAGVSAGRYASSALKSASISITRTLLSCAALSLNAQKSCPAEQPVPALCISVSLPRPSSGPGRSHFCPTSLIDSLLFAARLFSRGGPLPFLNLFSISLRKLLIFSPASVIIGSSPLICRVSTSVVPVLPKHVRRVRLPYPAPEEIPCSRNGYRGSFCAAMDTGEKGIHIL